MLLSSLYEKEGVSKSRQSVRDHLYADETEVISSYLDNLGLDAKVLDAISHQTKVWVRAIQGKPRKSFDIQTVLQAFPLSTEQGRALMSLGEALLRIPDSYTAKLLVSDKMSAADWDRLQSAWNQGGLVDFAAQGLKLADKFLHGEGWEKFFKVASDPVIVQAFRVMMKMMGREFILGRDIKEALERSLKTPKDRFSYDMLGEGARTWSMAHAYKMAYQIAIDSIAGLKAQSDRPMTHRDSISVKLSALHPHYNFAHYDQAVEKLVPDLIELCVQAKEAGIALTVDAEEVERLDLSMTVMEKVFEASELKGWDGFGFAAQAYQKRGIALIEWAEDLARIQKRTMMVRLVKGAYWDSEIKQAQVNGLPGYPVFTRKPATDISYLACAKRLLASEGHLVPQFATHNVYTIAAIKEIAQGREDIEFQRLQGMGEDIYEVVNQTHPTPVRVYAPVGDHHNLLAYLVRRLLENGANSSFVHKIYDKSLPLNKIVSDPFKFFKETPVGPHPHIPLPRDLYGEERINSKGDDLSDPIAVAEIKNEILKAIRPLSVKAGSGQGVSSTNPANTAEKVGSIASSTAANIEKALAQASVQQPAWDALGAEARAEILEEAADLFEEHRGHLMGLLIREGGKVLADAQSELREAVDFCRYYANSARKLYGEPKSLSGPTGELNQLQMRGRGIFACISPWNFPLAIFTGQVIAALAAGNAVVAKPAGQTPLIAYAAVELLHKAGVPQKVLHLLVGSGSKIGAALLPDPRISGVVFTGSTETAQHIQKVLTERGGPIVPLIAETGGLNAMIVDSSALIEEVVDDVIASAFQSAGQRCSALRVLFVQEDIYDPLMRMLKEAIEGLALGDPQWLSTDVGPVIDEKAQKEILGYVEEHKAQISIQKALEEGCEKGTYVPPTLITVKGMEDVKREVFGPVLHVAKFKNKDLENVMGRINAAGYGLTFGLQTRISSTMKKARNLAHSGNLYVNRNMIGAVVGVQPFGGEGLSGTGPKAGGPLYLTRFGVERTWSENIMASGGNVDLLNLQE